MAQKKLNAKKPKANNQKAKKTKTKSQKAKWAGKVAPSWKTKNQKKILKSV